MRLGVSMPTRGTDAFALPAAHANESAAVVSLLARFYPDYRDETWHFQRVVGKYVTPEIRVLDAGCGTTSTVTPFVVDTGCRVVGVDVDPRLAQNTASILKIRGRLEQLPLPDESFDLIISRYVMEHLPQPLPVFREMARILRLGGKLVILTPNLWHYVTLLSRLTPHSFHRWVNARRGVEVQDVFPTFYRCNARHRLQGYALRSGFQLVEMQMLETRPNYLLFSVPTTLLGVLYERVVNRFSFLSRFRVNILATFEKVEG